MNSGQVKSTHESDEKVFKGWRAGEVIQTAFKPFFRVLKLEHKGKFCENCLQRSSQLIKCKRCKSMYYCDKTCQTIDWESVHAAECHLEYFRNPPQTGFKMDYLRPFVIRLWALFKLNPNKKHEPHYFYDGRVTSINALLSLPEGPYKNPAIHYLAEEMTTALRKEGIPESECSREFIRSIGTLWDIFSFPIPSDESDKEYKAMGVYVEASGFDHSCMPNAFANMYERGFMEIRSIAPISEGMRPFLSVHFPKDHCSYAERKKHLMSHYKIDCMCTKCIAESANGDLIDYDRLRFLEESQRHVRTYEEFLKVHEEILEMLRIIYVEFDVRITFRIYGVVLALIRFKAPYEIIREYLTKADLHLLITRGTNHFEYKNLVLASGLALMVKAEQEQKAAEESRKQRFGKGRKKLTQPVEDERDIDEIMKNIEGDANAKEELCKEQTKGKKMKKRHRKKKVKGHNKDKQDESTEEEGAVGKEPNKLKGFHEKEKPIRVKELKGNADEGGISAARKRSDRRKQSKPKKNRMVEGQDEEHSSEVMSDSNKPVPNPFASKPSLGNLSASYSRDQFPARPPPRPATSSASSSRAHPILRPSLGSYPTIPFQSASHSRVPIPITSNPGIPYASNSVARSSTHLTGLPLQSVPPNTGIYMRQDKNKLKNELRYGTTKTKPSPSSDFDSMEELNRLLSEIAPTVDFKLKSKSPKRSLSKVAPAVDFKVKPKSPANLRKFKTD